MHAIRCPTLFLALFPLYVASVPAVESRTNTKETVMHRFVWFVVIVLSAALVVFPATAQETVPGSASAPPAMTNADVIALVSADLSDDLIIAKIHAAHDTSFDTSVDGLKALKAADISNAVIQVMINLSAASAGSGVVPQPLI